MRALVLCLALAAVVLSSTMAFAADTADITVTVKLQKLAISVTPTDWPIGVLAAGDPAHSSFTATNGGNVAEDLSIETGNTSPSGWTAGAASGTNVYVLGVGTDPTYTAVTAKYKFATSVAAGADKAFDLQFTAPAADSTVDAGGGSETFHVTVSAAAS